MLAVIVLMEAGVIDYNHFFFFFFVEIGKITRESLALLNSFSVILSDRITKRYA